MVGRGPRFTEVLHDGTTIVPCPAVIVVILRFNQRDIARVSNEARNDVQRVKYGSGAEPCHRARGAGLFFLRALPCSYRIER